MLGSDVVCINLNNLVQIDFKSISIFLVGKQWKEWRKGKLSPISFKYFPSFNSSSGKYGDTLIVHPIDSTMLFITSYYKRKIMGKRLLSLCFKHKTLTCKNHNFDCCDNGDCVNGKCSCYPGWNPETNCCAPSSCNATISILKLSNCTYLHKNQLCTRFLHKLGTFLKVQKYAHFM